MYRYDFQVDSETLRLPTLKELVGFTTTLSNHITSEFTRSPTTNLIIDTTIANSELQYESEVPELKKKRVNSYDLFKGGKNSSKSDGTSLESEIEKETLDNDILSSEEIQQRSSSAPFTHLEQTRNEGSSYDREEISKSDKEIERVEVPVTILDRTDGEEIAELVLLRVPESKLNSAILKPVFRVKILDHDNEYARNDLTKKRNVTKLGNFSESSSENELSSSFRSTFGKRRQIDSSSSNEVVEPSFEKHQLPNRPRNRQRIVKARRRTRPLNSLSQNDGVIDVRNSEREHFQGQVVRISRRRKNTEKSGAETTLFPEPLENFSNTITPTTLRGNHPLLSKVSNVTRGFYITRKDNEASNTFIPITTEYRNNIFDDTTQVLDSMTQDNDFTTPVIESTTPEMDSTIQTKETMTPIGKIAQFTEEERSTIQSITLIDLIQSPVVSQQLTTSLETVPPEYLSTKNDKITESTSSWDLKTDRNTNDEPEITTFRPRISKKMTTSDGTISMTPTTTGFVVNNSKRIENDPEFPKSGEATSNVSQPLKTSENSYWISSTTGEPNIVQSEKGSTQYDEQFKAQAGTFGTESTTVFSKITSYQSDMLASTTVKELKVETTTIPMQSPAHEFDKKSKPEVERSSQKTNNLNATVKIDSNRGGVRYTTTATSLLPIDGSSSKSRNKPQKLTSADSVSPVDTIATKSYDVRVRSTGNQKVIQFDTTSLPPRLNPSRRRDNRKETVRPLKVTENKSSSSNPPESLNTDSTVTNDYKNMRSRVHNRTTHLTTNYDQTTVNHAQTQRLSPYSRDSRLKTVSIENDTARRYTSTDHEANSISSTESYDKAMKSSTQDESTYLTMNSMEGIVSNLEAGQPFKNSSKSQKTSESSNSFKNISETSKSAQLFSNNSNKIQETGESFKFHNDINDTSDTKGFYDIATGMTEAYDQTTPSRETLSTSEHYKISPTSSSVTPDPSYTVLLEDQESTMTISTLSDSSSPVTSPESNEKTMEQSTLAGLMIDLTTNIVEPTGSDRLSSQIPDPGSEMTNLFMNGDSIGNIESINQASTKILATTNIYEETMKDESTTLMMNYPTTEPAEMNSGTFGESTTLDDTFNTFSTTIDSSDKITESINLVDTSVPYEVTTSETKETTFNYEGASISGNQNINDRKTDFTININDNTTKIMMEILESTTALYASDDRDKFVTNFTNTGTKITTQTVLDLPEEPIKDISISSISNEENSYITTIPNDSRTVLADSVSEKSIDKIINSDKTSTQINLREKELFSQNDVIPSEATSTTPIYDNSVYSTTDTSLIFQTLTIEPQMKRSRGRVRFTTFAGNSNDTDEQKRRPIKQVVVRRRLAKDRQQNATTLESNSEKSEMALSENRAKIENRNDENVEDQYKNTKNVKIQQLSDESAKRDHVNSSKSTRRRVVVYRGRPRSEKIVTTAKPVTTTTTATSTVQSSSSSTEVANNTKRRRNKWRKRLVLKRPRINVEEDDQSIAESGDFKRVLINEQYVKNSPDEITTSQILVPDILERFSEHEDIAVEVNPFKTTGAFLRRPGTLVRNDALKRLGSNSPNTSVPTVLPISQAAPFAKIKSVDPTYEMKTEDQSVRAQELAVTLSDPPAIDSSSTTGHVGLRTKGTTKKISTTVAPRTKPTSTPRTMSIVRRRQNGLRYNNNLRIVEAPVRPRRPAIIDYDYYVDDEIRLVLKPELKDKLFVTKKGAIRCLDQGNFAHPTSCKKFITCARMVNGQVVGTEYTCPDKLSFDPVGGICNWSAGLGCEEKSKLSN